MTFFFTNILQLSFSNFNKISSSYSSSTTHRCALSGEIFQRILQSFADLLLTRASMCSFDDRGLIASGASDSKLNCNVGRSPLVELKHPCHIIIR
jgi:hypothetical protein